MVPETFERTQLQTAHILSAHSQLRSLRETDPDSLQDLLRAALVLVERSFVSATAELAALAAPEAIRRGTMGTFLMDLVRSDAETVVRLWMASRLPEELSDLVRRRLRAEPPVSVSDLERMFLGTLNMPIPWDRAGELLASEQLLDLLTAGEQLLAATGAQVALCPTYGVDRAAVDLPAPARGRSA